MKQIGNSAQDSLFSKVYHALRAEIIEGRLAPGAQLIEARLSEQLGVSRTPVREALRRLEQDGLVDTTPNKCSVVVGIDKQDISDMYDIRILISGLCGEWAVKRMSDEEIAAMRGVLELQEFYGAKQEYAKVCELDGEFHDILYAGCKSRVVQQTLTTLHVLAQRAREISFSDDVRTREAIGEHRAIYEAIQAHDAPAAKKAARTHLLRAKEHVLKGL